jgi:hypothetical protein
MKRAVLQVLFLVATVCSGLLTTLQPVQAACAPLSNTDQISITFDKKEIRNWDSGTNTGELYLHWNATYSCNAPDDTDLIKKTELRPEMTLGFCSEEGKNCVTHGSFNGYEAVLPVKGDSCKQVEYHYSIDAQDSIERMTKYSHFSLFCTSDPNTITGSIPVSSTFWRTVLKSGLIASGLLGLVVVLVKIAMLYKQSRSTKVTE